jgi:hypothetical protein
MISPSSALRFLRPRAESGLDGDQGGRLRGHERAGFLGASRISIGLRNVCAQTCNLGQTAQPGDLAVISQQRDGGNCDCRARGPAEPGQTIEQVADQRIGPDAQWRGLQGNRALHEGSCRR